MSNSEKPALDLDANSLPPAFWSKVSKNEAGCWLWIASKSKEGYGRYSMPKSRRSNYAHRLAYEHLVGEIAAGLQIDHLCRVRNCVNPSHLEPVTARENTLRGVGITAKCAVVTHCPSGHEYDSTNTYNDRKGRQCKECSRIRRRANIVKARERGYCTACLINAAAPFITCEDCREKMKGVRARR